MVKPTRSRRNVLWTVFFHTRQLMALERLVDKAPVLPLFDSPYLAEEWILRMNLEQHYVSMPLWLAPLRQVLQHAEDNGMYLYTLNPPSSGNIPMEIAEIDGLLDQVELRLGVT